MSEVQPKLMARTSGRRTHRTDRGVTSARPRVALTALRSGDGWRRDEKRNVVMNVVATRMSVKLKAVADAED